MPRSIRLEKGNRIELPTGSFRATDRVAVITQGDTVIIKRLAVTRLSDLLAKVRNTPGRAPIRSIVREIRRYRRAA